MSVVPVEQTVYARWLDRGTRIGLWLLIATFSAYALGLAQPQVSKHLRVLREVGAVDVRDEGRQRLYRVNGHALKPIHDWVKAYERTWAERFEALDDVLEDLNKEQDDARD